MAASCQCFFSITLVNTNLSFIFVSVVFVHIITVTLLVSKIIQSMPTLISEWLHGDRSAGLSSAGLRCALMIIVHVFSGLSAEGPAGAAWSPVWWVWLQSGYWGYDVPERQFYLSKWIKIIFISGHNSYIMGTNWVHVIPEFCSCWWDSLYFSFSELVFIHPCLSFFP